MCTSHQPTEGADSAAGRRARIAEMADEGIDLTELDRALYGPMPEVWTCRECGATTPMVDVPQARRHRAGCSWLRGLDANPDGTPRQADA